MDTKFTNQTGSERHKPEVPRPDDAKDFAYSIGVSVSADGANKVGLDSALRRYVGARPALKYAEDMASRVVDLESDTGECAELYRLLRFKGLCSSLLERGIRSECMYGTHHGDADVAFSRLFLALALNPASEKSIIKNKYSDRQMKAFLTKANMAVFSKGSGVSVPRLEMIKVRGACATNKERIAIADEINTTLAENPGNVALAK
jgi:hypothetical protein